jgi:hypothetical protein
MTRQEPGLQVNQQADRRFLIQERMPDRVLLSFLVRRQHRLPRLLVHEDRAAFRPLKTGCLDLLAIDKRQYRSVSQKRAELLHQIERQTGAARSVTMQEPDRGDDPRRLARTPSIVLKDAV